MGAAAVMANTAIATAGDVPKMAQAFKKAIEQDVNRILQALVMWLKKECESVIAAYGIFTRLILKGYENERKNKSYGIYGGYGGYRLYSA